MASPAPWSPIALLARALPMPDEIRAFFDRYREAFDRLDGEAVAHLYAVPIGIASDGG